LCLLFKVRAIYRTALERKLQRVAAARRHT
jgi:hypothetical protein